MPANPTDPEPLLPRYHDLDPPSAAEPEPGSLPLNNIRHERFCREVARGTSPPEAFRLAGYTLAPSNACSNAARLSRREQIKARTSYLMRATARKLEISSERILQELALIGFARMQDYQGLLASGDLAAITNEQSAAISEIQITTATNGARRTKLKLASKREALVDLGKATGLFDDRPDITVPVTFLVNRTSRSDQRTDNEDDED